MGFHLVRCTRIMSAFEKLYIFFRDELIDLVTMGSRCCGASRFPIYKEKMRNLYELFFVNILIKV